MYFIRLPEYLCFFAGNHCMIQAKFDTAVKKKCFKKIFYISDFLTKIIIKNGSFSI